MTQRIALVTGAVGGLGTAICKSLAAAGVRVVGNFFPGDPAKEAWVEARKAEGLDIPLYGFDVSDYEQCKAAVEQIAAEVGPIDILVNNAGITKDNLVMRMSDAEWDAVIAVNLKGVFNCTKAVNRPMFKQRAGRIINIASIVGLMGNAGQVNYSATKGGVIAMTKTCAREFASRNVLVNAIAPGFIRTAMTDKLSEEQKQRLSSAIPLERLGEAQDVANAALFLASPESSYITGQVLSVNGGMYM